MLFASIGRVLLAVHDEHAPSDIEWAQWLEQYVKEAPRIDAVLVHSLGGGPNGRQRAELVEAFGQLDRVPLAYIVTSSVVTRGIVTAIGWFLPADRRPKTFPIEQLDRALDAIGLDNVERGRVKATIGTQQAKLAAARAGERHTG